MIREQKKRSNTQKRQKKIVPSQASENVQPTCFNTKGYFTADQPYNQQYLKIKQEVFKKYRNKDNQLVFIDPKMTKASAFIQRGMLKPNNHIYNELGANGEKTEKVLNNFLKNYMTRKERRQHQDQQRYFGTRNDSFGVSNVENTGLKSRTSRSVFSRAQTARSVCSSNKQN